MRVSQGNLGNLQTKTITTPDATENGQGQEKEYNLEQYMEYIPAKRDQDVRMANMLQQQGTKVLIY